MYGHETDSVFTDEDDHISFRGHQPQIHAHSASLSSWHHNQGPHPLNKRVLSDPAIHKVSSEEEPETDLYVNLAENLSIHAR